MEVCDRCISIVIYIDLCVTKQEGLDGNTNIRILEGSHPGRKGREPAMQLQDTRQLNKGYYRRKIV